MVTKPQIWASTLQGVCDSQQDATKKKETGVPGKEMKRVMLSTGGSEMA